MDCEISGDDFIEVEVDLVMLGVVPEDALALLGLLMLALAASGNASLIIFVKRDLAVDTLRRLPTAIKCIGGVVLVETSISEETRVGSRIVGEYVEAGEERAY